MEQKNKTKPRIFYLTGGADIANDYDTWAMKRSNATSFGGGVFMEQFFQFCHDIDADVYLISTASGTSSRVGRFILEYRETNTDNLTGFRYHVRMFKYMLGIIFSIIRFKPTLLLLGNADSYWFMLYPLYFSKMRIVPFFHSTIWPRMRSVSQLTFAQRTLSRLTAHFLKHRSDGVLAISEVIAGQIDQLARGSKAKIVRFRPIYDRSLFKDIRPPCWAKSPFRVIFVGRTTLEKGIYTLLEAARILRRSKCEGIVFDVCGTGRDFEAVSNTVKCEGLAEINLHGHCDREKLEELYSQCHVVVVPTPGEFFEGFNRVSIEGVLCGRPVIVSSAALESEIISAAIEIRPDDMQGFADAIVKLRDSSSYYEEVCSNARALQESFYNREWGWEQGLRSIIAA